MHIFQQTLIDNILLDIAKKIGSHIFTIFDIFMNQSTPNLTGCWHLCFKQIKLINEDLKRWLYELLHNGACCY